MFFFLSFNSTHNHDPTLRVEAPEVPRFVYRLSGRQALNCSELSAIVQTGSKEGFDIARLVERKRHPGQEEPRGHLPVCRVSGG